MQTEAADYSVVVVFFAEKCQWKQKVDYSKPCLKRPLEKNTNIGF